MDHDEREHSGRDRSDAKRELERAQDHFKRDLFFGKQKKSYTGLPLNRLVLGPSDDRRALPPANERTREDSREMEVRQAMQVCKMSHVLEGWQHMSLHVQLAALASVEREFAHLQRRPSVASIGYFWGPWSCRGAYCAEENRITLHVRLLRTGSPERAIRTYLHEARHAYQFDVIRNPTDHPEVSAAQLLLWNAAARLYPAISGNPTFLQELAYDLSFLERDASSFSRRQFKRIAEVIGHVF